MRDEKALIAVYIFIITFKECMSCIYNSGDSISFFYFKGKIIKYKIS